MSAETGKALEPLPGNGAAKRRSTRLLLRIPIEVRGTDADGRPFKERTTTLAINRHGALIVLEHAVLPETRVDITNLQNMLALPFRVVSQASKALEEGSEWGVECLEPERNFWGIFFPERAVASAKEERIDTLLECSACHARELAPLTLAEYEIVTLKRVLERPCSACASTTPWGLGVVAGESAAATPDTPQPCGARPWGKERRRAKRVPVRLPVRVRLEEIGHTENLSATGLCFSSSLLMKVGDRVMLTVGYDPQGDQKEVHARVVWRQAIAGSTSALYGVQLEGGD